MKIRAQCQRRLTEHQARLDVVRCSRRLGTTRASVALRMSARTLRHWRRRQRAQRLAPAIRGRRAVDCDVEVRNQVIHFLHRVTGPSVGLPALRCLFPKIPRCVLGELLTRYRRVWRRRYAPWGFRLTWHHAGRIWAMDHSEAYQPVDGTYPYLFAVRDLASHQQLAWQPMRTVTAEETWPILEALFQEHGAPLVLKNDNGSAFVADDLRRAVRYEEIAQLFSPPHCPSYNGAVERSNDVMKTYTGHHAVSEGHPHAWKTADVEHARQLANTISRPWGEHGPTPNEAWQARKPIDAEERGKFQAALAKHRAVALLELDLVEAEQPLSLADQARLDRLAMPRALEELGYLTFKRERRASQKPKRKSRERLQAELTQANEASTDDADAPTTSADKSGRDAESQHQRLAMLATIDTMNAGDARSSHDACCRLEACSRAHDVRPSDGTDAQRASPESLPARGERAISSWSRRLITPLVSLAKAAKITR